MKPIPEERPLCASESLPEAGHCGADGRALGTAPCHAAQLHQAAAEIPEGAVLDECDAQPGIVLGLPGEGSQPAA
eukprot:3900124-Pleurochrysis_carterae.AAC.2